MKKIIALLLSCSLVLNGCVVKNIVNTEVSSESEVSDNNFVTKPLVEDIKPETPLENGNTTEVDKNNENINKGTEDKEEVQNNEGIPTISITQEVQNVNFTLLDDTELRQYINDSVYSELEEIFDSDDYVIENVSSIYISKEYLEELDYNSQANIYFGYTLSELEEQFQGSKFVFTLGDDGQTVVQEFEEYYDASYNEIIKNIMIGTGVILVCVTVSVVSGALGLSTVSVIFAASAKTGTTVALSSGVFSGVSAGVVRGIQTKNFDEALKHGLVVGSEGFKWGAISGATSKLVKETYKILTNTTIPTPQESEKAAKKMYKDAKEQVAFLDKKEVKYNTPNSTRPDLLREIDGHLEAIEVKNYDLKNGLRSLCNILKKQVSDRITNLPEGSTQRIVLDVRGRNYSKEFIKSATSTIQDYLKDIYPNIPIDILL